MIPGGLTKRYSTALFDLCGQTTKRQDAQDALQKFREAYETVPELKELVSNPAFSGAERTSALRGVFQQLGTNEVVSRFLLLLLERERMELIGGICEDFRGRVDREMGRVRVQITSAIQMSPLDVKRAETALKKLTGAKEVIVESKVDPSVIGGVVTRIGNTVLDTSIQSQIDNMREHLLAG